MSSVLKPAADKISQHMCEVIAATPLVTSPYYYLSAQNVFPADCYAEMQRCLPATESYVRTDPERSGSVIAQQTRLHLNLASGQLDRVPDHQRPIWESVSQAVCSFPFVDQIFRKFAPGLSQRYNEPLDVRVRVELLRDSKGYEVLPHTDAPHKIFTLIFYLPPDEAQQQLGTAVYSPKDPGLTDEPGRKFPSEIFDEVSRVPFLPNTLFAFMKSDLSFHGRPPIEVDVERNMINCSFQISSQYVA